MKTVDDCRLMRLPAHPEPRGDLVAIEGGRDVPFEIRRVYTLTAVPADARRGGHGHRALEQVFVVLAGGLDVTVSDGERSKTWRLCRADEGLFIPKGLWRELTNFAPGTACMVLASLPYDEADYERSWEGFLRSRRHA
jgi:mannose-6-phosphate isomerase-like protein (cupin superfamily)